MDATLCMNCSRAIQITGFIQTDNNSKTKTRTFSFFWLKNLYDCIYSLDILRVSQPFGLLEYKIRHYTILSRLDQKDICIVHLKKLSVSKIHSLTKKGRKNKLNSRTSVLVS